MNTSIINFIKAVFLSDEVVEAILSDHPHLNKEALKKKMTSDTFLIDFKEIIYGEFTEKEMNEITSYFQSDSMKKLMRKYENLSLSVFEKVEEFLKSAQEYQEV